MQIYERLANSERKIEEARDLTLDDKQSDYDLIFNPVNRFKPIDADTKIFEVGTGTGWMQTLCKLKGLSCEGIEISPQLIDFARELGQKYGVEPDIRLGNIEDTDIGTEKYDVIIANCVLEHIEQWEEALNRIYRALKPDGLFYVTSTNKFSLVSGEYDFPLYGLLPDRWRYRLRVARQGEDIMKCGIDYNQFSFFQLRRFLKKLGYSTVLDRIDMRDPNNLVNPKPWKKPVLMILQRVKPLKHVALFFAKITLFICIK